MTNERRGIEAAQKAVDAFREHMGYAVDDLDPESLLSDLVTDLMYLADRQDISGKWLLERAETNYHEEADDDPEYVDFASIGAPLLADHANEANGREIY